jgi:hypothetical protein
MTRRLLPVAMLILAPPSRAQDAGPFPEPPEGARFVSVGVSTEGRQQIRKITYTEPSKSAPADEDSEPPPAQPVHLNLQAMELERENFDRWLFADGLSEEEHRRHLENVLLARARAVARTHKLTEPQRAKLLLAGRGDIKRFFDGVQDKRDEFETARQNFKTGFLALRNLDPLTRTYRQGPFGDGSLFSKTLYKIMNDRIAGR